MERMDYNMKKFGKFLFGTVSLAAIAAGAYYFYKNYIKKDASDDFDDFEDDFEDFEDEDETDKDKDSREYVSINITSDESEQTPVEDDEEKGSEE